MTEDEKKKMLAGFEKTAQDAGDDYWTDERLREMAKRIIERLHIDGELQ